MRPPPGPCQRRTGERLPHARRRHGRGGRHRPGASRGHRADRPLRPTGRRRRRPSAAPRWPRSRRATPACTRTARRCSRRPVSARWPSPSTTHWIAEAYRIDDGGDGVAVAAGSTLAAERALTALVRAARADGTVPTGDSAARHGWRGLHIDLARRAFPAADVEWLVDVAAWHGLNRLHLHLTDDEAWRVPVPGFPELVERGAWRGHGLAVPALVGSGAAPYGVAYSADDIARWHARADGTRRRARARDRPARPLLRGAGGAAGARRPARHERRGERPALRRQRPQPRCAGDVGVAGGGVRRARRPVPVAVAAPRRRRGAARAPGWARRSP